MLINCTNNPYCQAQIWVQVRSGSGEGHDRTGQVRKVRMSQEWSMVVTAEVNGRLQENFSKSSAQSSKLKSHSCLNELDTNASQAGYIWFYKVKPAILGIVWRSCYYPWFSPDGASEAAPRHVAHPGEVHHDHPGIEAHPRGAVVRQILHRVVNVLCRGHASNLEKIYCNVKL